VPTVIANRTITGLASVVVADDDGGAQAVGHLHALGHRRIAIVGGPATSHSGAHRLAGSREAAAHYGGIDLVELGHFAPSYSGGVVAADHALASGATAVLAYNDLVALGILSRFAERGVRVPHDMSVVGFDDVPVAALVSPALTTVNVPREAMGRQAVALLLDQLTGDGARSGPDAKRVLPVNFVVRASTAAYPTASLNSPAVHAG
jgi:DNA-binding LacI/PurR family transcriptional regulator